MLTRRINLIRLALHWEKVLSVDTLNPTDMDREELEMYVGYLREGIRGILL